MEAVQPAPERVAEPNRLRRIFGQYNWRMMLMRVLINGLTLMLVAALVPNIYFPVKRLYSVLVMALILGVLNFLVKPVIQWITLPFIFATYGFVVVLINTIILWGLSRVSNLLDLNFFHVEGLLWAIIGGLVMGVVASLLESLFGLNIPVSTQPEVLQAVSSSRAAQPRTLVDMVDDDQDGDEDALDEPGGNTQ